MGVRSGNGVGAAALTGVGKMLAVLVYADNAESLLSGLAMDALGSVDAVGLSSSVCSGRPCGGSIRSGWPRYVGRGSRFCWCGMMVIGMDCGMP